MSTSIPKLSNKLVVSDENPLPTKALSAANITTKFREAFETYDNATRWREVVIATGDLVVLDGNAAAASYLVISKDPLSADTETVIESRQTFGMPFELALGLHASQRTLGQELVAEAVSTETNVVSPSDVAISTMSQSTTTLTVTTATAHGLKPGMRIGIKNAADSRFNYSALVVASTPSPTQFTATAGPGGTIPSLTAGTVTSGSVYYRPALGGAPNGTSMILENATVTNASFYVRAEAGDVLPTGTILGNHSVTILTTASVQAIAAALTYAFQPTDEYKLTAFIDSIQWSDVAVDSTSQANARVKRTQVVPDVTPDYKIRFRAKNLASLTRPVARIVSVTKSGTTTATVVTDVAHGLTTSDYINTYGVRDQTNFANLTTATVIASVVNSTTFTVVWGSAVTATSYGGYVARVNGGQVMQGALTMSAQSVSRTSNVVALVGSASWSGALIGDLVNLHGCRDNASGADLGLDGSYRARDIQTTTLYLEPVGSAPTGADIASTNCGGAIIKRTDLRLSYVRVLDFDRLRIEVLPRPSGDASSAQPVTVANTPAVTISGTPNVAISGNPVLGAGTSLMGDVGVQMRSTGSAFSVVRLPAAAASTNATLIKSSAGKLARLTGYNAATSVRYLKLYNKASAPTVGTDTPVATLALPPSKEFSFDWANIGLIFATGVGFGLTTGSADSDTGALSAADVVGLNFYYV